MRHLKDLPVLVLGLGASGLAMARWCARHGAVVTVADTREAPASLATLKAELPGVTFVGGPFSAALVEGTPIRAVYRSPGLSPEAIAPVADAARAMGLPVGGELDLFARALLDLQTVEVPVVEAEPEAEVEAEPEAEVEAEAQAAEAEAEPAAQTAPEAAQPDVPAPVEASAPEVVAAPETPEAVEPAEPAELQAVPAEPVEATQAAQPAEAQPEPTAPAMAEAMPRDPSISVAVPVPVPTQASEVPEAPAEPVAGEATPEPAVPVTADANAVSQEAATEAPAAETPGSPEAPEAPAASPEQASTAAPASAPAAATVSRLPSTGKPYVPTAAKEAAEFVAKIAELSATNPASAAVEEESQQLVLAPAAEPPAPEAPKGYTPAVLAITGTNGKTTVTSLTGQLVERAGKTVAVAGNIGPTLLDTLSAHMDADTLPDVWVLELSSFQLDGVQGFEPTAATVLNLTQDHLDWHGGMPAYAAAKARIFGARGLMILNRDDDGVMAMLPPPLRVKLQRPQVRTHVTFGSAMPLRPGDYGIERVNGMAWLVRALEADETQKRKRGAVVEEEIFLQRLMPADALRIRGRHNAMNALAALALASAADCPLGPMLYGLREYRGEPHRVEPIAIVDEVEYFDDSKGTNVGATVAALNGLGEERRVVVILGGEGKGQDFDPLAAPVRQYARAVVLIGRDAPLIEAALASTGVSLMHAASMHEAVKLAGARANPGDAVLLSPACASFDMFKDYAHRADVFREAVQAWEDSPRGLVEGLASDSTEEPL
ncbi:MULTISPECIES: UDP-N-acetylmuramoyl-L-alanine--D-glutamate ligase [unclassified Variovorax]|uniref:UDP-N-acetylmuramoyl-L-alanine--D-glutamate ligase n=1 Tax=unclassified Variovorax TaxID=663243 RepID=UPI0008BAA625|nr:MULTISPECIES: UDP-N-acetylmuramoyl-L-alanine--D-glutamate ligase [unclassified Variovorax]SEI98491.1 UDP-N-acetylmuramoylalanine--D-glutamate ligase [Variovorax sp. OK202]SFB88999.1 UDP-N-acetylmuramoylalanine--D-glutamate ligase [Variovorax sp. OK212]